MQPAPQEEQSGMQPAQQQPFGMQPVPPIGQPDHLKHSGPGIASFIIGILSIGSFLAGIGLFTASVLEMASNSDFALSEDEIMSSAAILSGVALFLVGILLSLVGLILGIVGTVIKNRRRVFAILGLVFNALIFIGIIGLIVIGQVIQQ